MLKRISVAGLQIDAVKKTKLLSLIEQRIKNNQKTFLTTLYSEFLYAAVCDKDIMQLLNSANLAIADGMGILWAQYFLSKRFSFNNFYLKIIQACWQVVCTGAAILIIPHKLYQAIPEKIVGADLVWDLAELAANNNFSIFIWGGFGDTTDIVQQKLLKRFPSLRIVGTSNAANDDAESMQAIKQKAPDMLLVAFGPVVQERWISEHLQNLPIKFAIGLGGTFDYMAKKRKTPPAIVRASGLEWLYRLLTQPNRVKRIYNALVGLIVAMVRYKVFESCEYRPNVAAVVVNADNKILVCKRQAGPAKNGSSGVTLLNDYWQFPQGGLDDGEEIIAGAIRELSEETGINNIVVLGTAKYINSYTWNNATRHLFGNSYHFKGQEQHTIYLKFSGNDSDIDLDNKELVEYRWVNLFEIDSLIATERMAHTKAIQTELQEILNLEKFS